MITEPLRQESPGVEARWIFVRMMSLYSALSWWTWNNLNLGDWRLFYNDMKGIIFAYDDFLVRNDQGIDFATEYPKTILSAPSLSIAWKTTSEGPNSPACTDRCTWSKKSDSLLALLIDWAIVSISSTAGALEAITAKCVFTSSPFWTLPSPFCSKAVKAIKPNYLSALTMQQNMYAYMPQCIQYSIN